MKKIYICPELDIYETEIDGLMTDLWSRTQTSDASGTGGGGAGSAGGGPGGGSGSGGPAAKGWGKWESDFSNFEEDDFEDEY